jgi:DNA-binding helix-hairpin-helix protein with protein kinase domain
VLAPRPAPPSSIRLHWPGAPAEAARLQSIGKSGGAGEVYAIVDRPALVAKIYHPAIRAAHGARYERKLHWMLANRPQLPVIPAAARDIVQLAWPLALVSHHGRFAGFVMDKIDFSRTLELDYLLTRRQAAAEGFEADYGKLLTICRNLAALIDGLHARRIAVVDLKPINLKVYKDELFVSILDCDGFHLEQDGFLAQAPQVTPEYLAPEFHERAVARPQAQDAFALATIVFRLLNYGIHPYAGIAAPRQPYPTELAGRIRLGLYPYGRTPHPGLRPAPASVHDCLPAELRALFDRAFGPAAGLRPRADEWTAALGAYASRDSARMARCAQGHLQFAGLPCPSCRREQILQGHVERRRRFLTRLQATPARAASYVRRSLRGTQSSPFQAALAQVQLNSVQLAPITISIRNMVAIEIVWTLGLLVTWWWLK